MGRYWTVEEALAYDSLDYGYENVLYWEDRLHQEATAYCEVCERVFHVTDLCPCDHAEAVCAECRASWEAMEADAAALVMGYSLDLTCPGGHGGKA